MNLENSFTQSAKLSYIEYKAAAICQTPWQQVALGRPIMKARSVMFSFTRYSYRQDSCNESPVIHAHPQYEIGYIHSGSLSYMMGGRKIDIESGDLILLSGLTIHGVHARVHDMIGSKFVFDAQLAQIFSSTLLSFSPLEPFKTVNNARIRLGAEDREEFERILAQIDRFHRLHRQDQTQFNRMLVAFFDLLLFIGAQCGVAELERSSPSKDKERLAREVIELSVTRMNGKRQLARLRRLHDGTRWPKVLTCGCCGRLHATTKWNSFGMSRPC